MLRLVKHKVILAGLGAAAAACVILIVWLCGATPQDEFLRNLDEYPLFHTDGIASISFGVHTCRARLREARELRVNLFEAYKRNLDRRNLRLSLAYLLLLDENEPYVEYARSNPSAFIESGELRLWNSLANDTDPAGLSKPFKRDIYAVLNQIDHPLAVSTTAKLLLDMGEEVEAVRRYLDVLRAKPYWDQDAYSGLKKIPVARRVSLLLPFLETKTVRGAYAAMMLGFIPEHRQRAVSYLRELVDSQSEPLVNAARECLTDFTEAPQAEVEEGD